MQTEPVNGDAVRPKLTGRGEQAFRIGGVIHGRIERRGDQLRRHALAVLSSESAQCLAGADFQQRDVGIDEVADASEELYGLPELPGPVRRIGGLAVRNGPARQAGYPMQRGRATLNGLNDRREAPDNGFHHRRVERMRGVQYAAHDSLRFERTGEFSDGLVVTGNYGEIGRVDCRNGCTRSEVLTDDLFGRAHRQHRARRHVLHQARTLREYR